MSVSPIPPGYHHVTPYVAVKDLAAYLAFLERAFEATVAESITLPNGELRHVEVLIGDTRLMLGKVQGPASASQSTFYHYTADVDAVFERAIACGAESIMPPELMPYGDRSGGVRDPEGNSWWIATHIEDVSPDEVARRMGEGP